MTSLALQRVFCGFVFGSCIFLQLQGPERKQSKFLSTNLPSHTSATLASRNFAHHNLPVGICSRFQHCLTPSCRRLCPWFGGFWSINNEYGDRHCVACSFTPIRGKKFWLLTAGNFKCCRRKKKTSKMENFQHPMGNSMQF